MDGQKRKQPSISECLEVRDKWIAIIQSTIDELMMVQEKSE